MESASTTTMASGGASPARTLSIAQRRACPLPLESGRSRTMTVAPGRLGDESGVVSTQLSAITMTS